MKTRGDPHTPQLRPASPHAACLCGCREKEKREEYGHERKSEEDRDVAEDLKKFLLLLSTYR